MTGSAPSCLATAGLTIGHGRTVVARDITISVSPGEVLCLLGPNGCGKTTLFRTLLGLLPPLAGSVSLAGQDLGRLARRDVARLVAYVPQSHVPTFPYTVTEVVTMGRAPHLGTFGHPGAADRHVCGAALDRLGLGSLADRDYALLSAGQRQLVLIARALVAQAGVIVMDEPTSSLDFGNRLLVLEQIRSLAAAGLAIVLSTHDPDQALAVGTRAALMRDAGVVADGPPDEVMDARSLAALYGVPIDVIRLDDGRRVCLAQGTRAAGWTDASPAPNAAGDA